jgi:ribosome-binding ATPase YchF (GTP1/OBG family)
LQTAIVGLAGAGKTTVFNTLTRGHAETGGFGGVTLNVGVVKVPDARLDRLAEIFKPKKMSMPMSRTRPAGAARLDRGVVGTEEPPPDHPRAFAI